MNDVSLEQLGLLIRTMDRYDQIIIKRDDNNPNLVVITRKSNHRIVIAVDQDID